jgi:succinate dehydrogenase/fumarate reductase flavoprotein subunit
VSVGGTPFLADAGVVLACGGFEWNAEMVEEHFGDRLATRCSPPHNTGDGHRMAGAAGARLADMDQAWWAPMALLPEETREGRGIGKLIRTERQGPGSLMVNRRGRRFTDESQNYNTLVREYLQMAAEEADAAMFVVFDQRFLDRFGFITHRSGQDLPVWLTCAPSLDELARVLGIDDIGLSRTVQRFNGFAHDGCDLDFARGDDVYDRYGGDPENPYPNPCLAPLDCGPFYGMPLAAGAFGTSGGVLTDDRARALDADGAVIDGLFAVGNVSAHPVAAGYPGAGGTLGPTLTMGYLAGQTVGLTDRAAQSEMETSTS